MTRKLASITLALSSIFIFSCNSKDDKPKEKVEGTTTSTTTPKNEVSGAEETSVPSNPEAREAAIGYCECFNQNFKKVDPKIQNIFIKAAESPDPLLVLQKEILSITDPAEQQRLGEEMQKLSGSQEMETCAKKLEQKYKIDENDKATQRQMLKALEGNEDCKLVAALMRIGLKQAEMNSNYPPRQ